MKEIIKIKNLYKTYGKINAVNDLNLKVNQGQLYAFLGVNGAGKSTTISMISGILKKDSGEIFICGKDIEKESNIIKKYIGIVFQESVLDKSLTVYENLKYRAGLYGIIGKDFIKIYEQIEDLFELQDIKNSKLAKLSGGQRRKVDIARAIIHKPKLLILDEPTTGLDPGTRKKIWNTIRKLRKEYNMTIFLTTHYMEEAADADYISIIDKGKIIAEGTPLELKNKYASDTIIIYNVNEEKIKNLNLPYKKIKNAIKIEIKNTKEATNLIIKNKNIFQDYEIIKGRMDDVFLSAIGYEIEGEL
ncbi:MAG: ABC transporter ATP-binding protein [bacterium]|nr:ABC transporter ATP-binding protein [bacterium]